MCVHLFSFELICVNLCSPLRCYRLERFTKSENGSYSTRKIHHKIDVWLGDCHNLGKRTMSKHFPSRWIQIGYLMWDRIPRQKENLAKV